MAERKLATGSSYFAAIQAHFKNIEILPPGGQLVVQSSN